MKKILSTLVFIAAITSLFAQSQGFRYQTVLRDATRQYLVDQQVDFRFSILEGDANGPEVYVEEHAATTNQLGLVNLTIGAGNVTGPYDFADIPWVGNSFFLKVEIKPAAENDFILMGTSALLAVPFAEVELSDNDRDPENEIQELTLTTGDTLVISNGNLISLAKYRQTLSLAGNSLSISDGNSVSLDKYAQNLSLNGDDLAISNGNSVPLAKYRQELSHSGDTVSLSNGGGNLVLNYAKPSDLYLSLSGNYLSLGYSSVYLGSFMDSPWTRQSSSRIYYPYQVAAGTSYFAPGVDFTAGGSMEVSSSSTNRKVFIGSASGGGGYMEVFGDNNKANFTVSTLATNNDNGYVGVYGGTGFQSVPPVRMFVDNNGKGVLAADIKHFWMPHPKNPSKEIWYVSLEGPEAAAYERGTAKMVNGEAFIPFSEHFELVINPATMTVVLTPLSASSLGMAVVEKTATGFRVKELHNGSGNYDFDWEAKGVRKGYENYKVIKDAKENLPSSFQRND